MTTQPEALRLAEVSPYLEGGERGQWIIDAAAELRRLHEAHDWQYRMAGERLRRIEKLEAQRDALLEALKEYGWHHEGCPQYPTYTHPDRWPACTCGFDDAIKAVEEQT